MATKKVNTITIDTAIETWKYLSDTDIFYVRGEQGITDEVFEDYKNLLTVDGSYKVIKPFDIIDVKGEKIILDGNTRFHTLSRLRASGEPLDKFEPITFNIVPPMTELELIRHQNLSNSGRKHTFMQQMSVIKYLLDKGVKGTEISATLGVSNTTVSEANIFMSLDQERQEMVNNGEISQQTIVKIAQTVKRYGLTYDYVFDKIRNHSGEYKISLTHYRRWRTDYDKSLQELADKPLDVDVDTENTVTVTTPGGSSTTKTQKRHISIELPSMESSEDSETVVVDKDIKLSLSPVNGDTMRLRKMCHAMASVVDTTELNDTEMDTLRDILRQAFDILKLSPEMISKLNNI